ncbi:MAG: hypothetical protein HYR85_27110 [Planctomycetes bacterium]|nr:hypothetical protein [Planctomycetota bacterium]MBI3847264.1 hypothetical protein [Planctomycetota bacterium]
MNRSLFFGMSFVILGIASLARGNDPWPAESLANATNLTAIEGPGANDFYFDLSSAVWNSETRTLWVCRNGPSPDSKVWALVEDGAGSFEVSAPGGLRAEWTGFGDAEALTQADFAEDVVYVMAEGEERIKEYDLSTPGVQVLNNDWNTRPYLPLSGGLGSEAITFVPDSFLTAIGFVDANGLPYTSTQGMGGVMMVGHQNGGAIYVFDLNRTTGGFVYVGEYLTGDTETADLEFDRSTGLLYVLHDDADSLEVLDLTSTAVVGQTYRQFTSIETFDLPSVDDYEGIAVVDAADCHNGERSLFLTIDDGGATSLLWFKEFTHGCPPPDCLEGRVNDAGGGREDVLLVNGSAGGANRDVVVSVGAPVQIAMNASSSGSGAGRYVMWVWNGGARNPVDILRRGELLGCMGNPTPLQPAETPQPIRCLHGVGIPGAVCGGVTRIHPPATNAVPWSFTIANGFPAPIVLTVQGIVEDLGAANSFGFSVTNGVRLRITP